MALDLNILRERMERDLDWHMVEQEGPTTIRFDIGQSSVWIHQSGEIENVKSMGPGRRKFICALVDELEAT